MAIGTFHPEIEIWNTDVLDALEPEAVLGGLVAGKRRTLKPGSHRQAVMGLSWNREYRNVLASSSADSTVKLWDVTSQHCMLTLNYHKDKVPVVHFHPVEANILLTASYDRVCAVTDGRSPSTVSLYVYDYIIRPAVCFKKILNHLDRNRRTFWRRPKETCNFYVRNIFSNRSLYNRLSDFFIQ